MDYDKIIDSINEVKEKLECEYSKWNESNDWHIIEECIWAIKGLEIKLNNLYIKAKSLNSAW